MNIRTFVTILSRNPKYDFPKMGEGVKGCLELFRKFIRFGNVLRPLVTLQCNGYSQVEPNIPIYNDCDIHNAACISDASFEIFSFAKFIPCDTRWYEQNVSTVRLFSRAVTTLLDIDTRSMARSYTLNRGRLTSLVKACLTWVSTAYICVYM